MADSPAEQEGLARAIGQVSDHAVGLVREEIELAKAEIRIKVEKFSRGLVVGIAAGVFALTGLLFLLQSIAWAAWQLLFGSHDYWGGFLFVAIMLFVLAGVAGYLAYRWLQSGSKPAPTMAIDEARRIRETVATATQGEPVAPATPTSQVGKP